MSRDDGPPEGLLSAFVVAGTHSGVGKTSVTLGLIGALQHRGQRVQPFKVGPDFIDPLHHRAASGRVSRNLDGWMLTPEANLEIFARATADADVGIVEGVMGLFDGSEGKSDRGSTAEMAKRLSLPVVLIVDVGAMARSAAALIHGFSTFDADVHVAGVILNKVGGALHADMIRDAIDGAVPILGAIPLTQDLVVPERHLGLHLPHEARAGYVERLTAMIEQHVDIDALLQVSHIRRPPIVNPREGLRRGAAVRIAVARDEAFCFYYPENLELLDDSGAEIIEFSPIRDPFPPDVDGLYIGGGYPELHASELSAAKQTREQIRAFARAGGPVYAECGGLMYLARSLSVDGETYPMCGLLPFETRMTPELSIAYVEIETRGGNFGDGLRARGHLFHHSEIVGSPEVERLHTLTTTWGEAVEEGFQVGSVLASYAHLHFASEPELARAFVQRCREFRG